MEGQEGERFNDNPWEPYPHPHDDQGFHPHGGGFHGNGGNYHQNGGFGVGHGGEEFHHRRINAPPDGSFCHGGGFGRGRGYSKPQFARKRNFLNSDYPDGGNFAKLFVGGIARTTSEEDIRSVFGKHGDIIEVIILQDKRTSQQYEYCFVKYYSTQEADRAISALNNQFTFLGGTAPIRVKYAEGQRDRLAAQHKVYVNGLNRQASREEIVEIFSSYGFVEDIYLMYDDHLKQSRGCGFVGFTYREMAVAAINGLNGTYVMRGCDQPLVVRFADPKKPRIREPRPAPDCRDFRDSMAPGAAHFGNSCGPPCENAAIMGVDTFTPFSNSSQPPSSSLIHQPIQWQPVPPPHSIQMPSLQVQVLHGGSQSSNRVETYLHPFPDIASDPQIVTGASVETNGAVSSSQSASPRVARCDSVEDAPDCDWSEHICPDGHKYYYNCMTYDSRWEKPEEFSLYEEQLHKRKQQLHHLPGSEIQPLLQSEVPSCEESTLSEAMEYLSHSSQPGSPQKPMSSVEEHNHEKLTANTNPALV
ncbi:hypothetical protein Dimus_032511 [Dionaea muscipula]